MREARTKARILGKSAILYKAKNLLKITQILRFAQNDKNKKTSLALKLECRALML
jgi:hypothetical protein